MRKSVRNAVVDALRKACAAYQGNHLPDDRWAEVEASIDNLGSRFDTAFHNNMTLLRQAVERVRNRVGPQRWEAFRLVAEENLKGSEVAARLGMTPSQVYNARHDIRAYLREELLALGYKG
jgi:DNA-directed RNA polymerase specialized sigma24 family protein